MTSKADEMSRAENQPVRERAAKFREGLILIIMVSCLFVDAGFSAF
jgi:hypothetical protein